MSLAVERNVGDTNCSFMLEKSAHDFTCQVEDHVLGVNDATSGGVEQTQGCPQPVFRGRLAGTVDSTCQATLNTRDVYCQAWKAAGDVCGSVQQTLPVLLTSEHRRQTGCSPHQLRRGFSDVQCQIDNVAMVNVYSQCENKLLVHRGSADVQCQSGSGHLYDLKWKANKRNSASQCDLRMTSCHVHCQTMTPEGQGQTGDDSRPVQMWASTDGQSQTGSRQLDATCQHEDICCS